MQKSVFITGLLLVACTATPVEPFAAEEKPLVEERTELSVSSPMMDNESDRAMQEVATFAGGCFWCVEPAYQEHEGVSEAVSGYSGGSANDATYEKVSSGRTDHVEAVQVVYDSSLVSYEELLEIFWRQIDPTDDGGQFVDRGSQYRTVIFYHNDEQKRLAEASRESLLASGRYDKPIVTRILPFEAFYPAEEYHQDFYKKSKDRYKGYREGSGRDQYLESVWDEQELHEESGNHQQYERPSDEEIKAMLTPLQYTVTQEEGTEPPFDNEYNDTKEEGIYVDIVSGEPLFSSKDKYDSGTGWPSFRKPLASEYIAEKEDRGFFTTRTEVRSKYADSHLGHVFTDGPEPTGLRYCMNSAALRFIPKDRLEEEGYEEFVGLFE